MMKFLDLDETHKEINMTEVKYYLSPKLSDRIIKIFQLYQHS